MTWSQCCDKAVEIMRECEGCEIKIDDENEYDKAIQRHNDANLWVASQTIMQWFCNFCLHGEKFPNIPKYCSLQDRIPPIFDQNPNLKDKFISYAKENLVNLNPLLMYEYCTETLIPEFIAEERKANNDENQTRESILAKYRIKNLCMCTIYNWMEALGFKYSLRRKTYYVDGHEQPDNVAACVEYIDKYLKYERRCF